jgi:hypothetical protein
LVLAGIELLRLTAGLRAVLGKAFEAEDGW